MCGWTRSEEVQIERIEEDPTFVHPNFAQSTRGQMPQRHLISIVSGAIPLQDAKAILTILANLKTQKPRY